MLEAATDLKSVWYLIVALVAAVAWLVRLESRVNTIATDCAKLDERHTQARKEMSAQWTRLDDINLRLSAAERINDVHKGMLKPENLEKHYIETTRFQTSVEHRLAALEERQKAS